MIATHNTFTYLTTKNVFVNLLKTFWRCQVDDIGAQYNNGVRYFDIRVKYKYDHKLGTYWQVCHGIANVDIYFKTAKELSEYIHINFPEAIYRVLLESYDDEYEILLFKEEFFGLQDSKLVELAIKHPWEILFMSNSHPSKTIDLCCKLFNWNPEKSIWYNIKNFDFSSISIKKWAKKHNPKEITKDMLLDKSIVYFLDYYNLTL